MKTWGKRKIFVILLILTVSIMLCCLAACSNIAEKGLNFSLNAEGDSYSVSSYTGNVSTVKIPSEYKNLPVTGILDGAFKDNAGLIGVAIPKSVTNIGILVFSGCENLATITVENGNPIYYSESNCIIQADSKTLIAGCGTSVISNDGSVLMIGESAFEGSSIESVMIPAGVIRIGSRAFYNCRNLKNVDIPDSVERIEELAFAGCGNMASISIGEGNAVYRNESNCLIEIGSKTLIAGYENSIIPKDGSVTKIGGSAFSGSSIERLVIPDCITSIGVKAFFACDKLKTVRISRNVTRIEDKTFYLCGSLTTIEIPNGVTSIGERAFYHCIDLTNISIPDSVVSFKDNVFFGCSGLTNLTIPKNVTDIGFGIVNGCNNLTSMNVAEGNQKYHSNGNCVIATDSKTIVAGCVTSVIPDDASVNAIGAYAFRYCEGLTDIVIPNNITSIGDSAFQMCADLTEITITDSVTNIGQNAFYGCSALTIYISGLTGKPVGWHGNWNPDSRPIVWKE